MDDFEYRAAPAESQVEVESPRALLARHWGLLMAVGINALIAGLVLAAWPHETVTVVAYMLAFQLLVVGCAATFLGITPSQDRGSRLASGLAGAFTIVVGALLLLDPLQTLTFMSWFFGLAVLAVGVSDFVGAVRAPRHRWWRLARGALGAAAGLLLVVSPDVTLRLLVLITCVWLIVYGVISIIAAIVLRHEQHRG
jgi:uncharacterized membrane protein HdeD (DUF308 family)